MSDQKDLKRTNKQNASMTVQQTVSVGPIPAAAEFGSYEQVLKGSANRILAMAEKNQEMNFYAIKAAVTHEHRMHNTIRMVVFLVLVGAFALVIMKGDLASYTLLIGALAGLIGSFVFSKKTGSN